MPHKCDSCGEFAPCSKERDYFLRGQYVYTCKKCSDYYVIKLEQDKEEYRKLKREFVKRRDKVLKEAGKC